MTLGDPRSIAARLGLPQEAVRGVQRRGFLRRLDLDEMEIRERAWQGHLTFVQRRRRFESADEDEGAVASRANVKAPRAAGGAGRSPGIG